MSARAKSAPAAARPERGEARIEAPAAATRVAAPEIRLRRVE
jgi:hypothetical protein